MPPPTRQLCRLQVTRKATLECINPTPSLCSDRRPGEEFARRSSRQQEHRCEKVENEENKERKRRRRSLFGEPRQAAQEVQEKNKHVGHVDKEHRRHVGAKQAGGKHCAEAWRAGLALPESRVPERLDLIRIPRTRPSNFAGQRARLRVLLHHARVSVRLSSNEGPQ